MVKGFVVNKSAFSKMVYQILTLPNLKDTVTQIKKTTER